MAMSYSTSSSPHATSLPAQALTKEQRYRARHPDRIRAKNVRWYALHRAYELARSRRWKQAHPESVRASSRQRRRLHLAACLATNQRWRAAHPDASAAQHHRRRARKQNAASTDLRLAQWNFIKAVCGYRCVYGGRKLQRLTQDHLTPLVDGGAHSMDHVLPACHVCNCRKGVGRPLCPVQPFLALEF